MTIVKPSTLPGFLELLPGDQILFNEMIDTIRKNYEAHGFLPIDTPVIEKSEVLLAKGGGETEKQIYRFQKGDTDMSLRFDLTVPLARYTAEHFNELAFPFKRYQIGKVYRGEKAQKGRFREFYQCDIDTIGNGSLSILNDAEIPVIIYHTFKDLGFDKFIVKINNRKILNGFYRSLEITDTVSVLRTVDKLDKIGRDNVIKELIEIGVAEDKAEKIMAFTAIGGTNEEILAALKAFGITDSTFEEGLDELKTVVDAIAAYGVPDTHYTIDLKIARGLDYYTGTVYETELVGYESIGSVCSGGRYEDLASFYTDKKLPGVGISIGLSRLYYQLSQAKLIEAKKKSLVDVLVIPMDGLELEGIKIIQQLTQAGVAATLYAEQAKMNKKFKFADKLEVPYTLVVGETEVAQGIFGLKHMQDGTQEDMTIEAIIAKLKK
ncbi:histidine--tRNA ligase [Peptoniphilus equinus]|uniref:Histidine--tRNA ligase n=1 Tax=Peptoniphilus equinus TaxID=3016343 RepID=A0ABY7QSR8_9FIRM|nr:histidine--tRNA ligase [Peptoniphilus equinus]WBW49834.1 histidine--tRNA ligase [Peptoniphilus equinus]